MSQDGENVGVIGATDITVLSANGSLRDYPVVPDAFGSGGAVFSPDGKTMLVWGCNDKLIRWLDLATGSLTRVMSMDACPGLVAVDASRLVWRS